jgi:hypothetical protein
LKSLQRFKGAFNVLTDDDNEDQFYCTEAKLLELNNYFPNDFTAETYYEFQHELSKHQFEIALTLTFNHPCYDDYTASSYAMVFRNHSIGCSVVSPFIVNSSINASTPTRMRRAR